MSETIEVKVPDIGDFKDVEVIEVLVKAGDTIKAEQSLVTVESDKASMEIPSSTAGVIREVRVKLGDKLSEGVVVVTLEPSASSKPARAPAADVAPTVREAASAAPGSAAPSSATASTASASAHALRALVALTVPDIGDFKDVEVIEVLVAQGDVIKAEQSLVTVESDKASMEIPASTAGIVKELLVKVGTKINAGDVLAMVQPGDDGQARPAVHEAPGQPAANAAAGAERVAPTVVSAAPVAPAIERAPPVIDAPAPPSAQVPHASPSIRKFARELGVDLSRVTGSAPKGRITQQDVQLYVKTALASAVTGMPASQRGSSFGAQWPAWPSLDFAKFGETETVPLPRIKKISGPNLARNWATIPHVTQFDEADVTDLEAFRKSTNEALAKQGVKVTMLAFVMKACVAALEQFPAFNSSLDATGEHLILKKYFSLGFAADTPNGLVVPVVKDCDKKGVAQLAKETSELAAKARDGKLSPADMSGACFSISSLGGIGGTLFTPIINAPEVAILGLSKTELKPKWDGHSFQPRLILPLSLSYDHRVIDGAQGARFTTYLAEVLADMRRVLL